MSLPSAMCLLVGEVHALQSQQPSGTAARCGSRQSVSRLCLQLLYITIMMTFSIAQLNVQSMSKTVSGTTDKIHAALIYNTT